MKILKILLLSFIAVPAVFAQSVETRLANAYQRLANDNQTKYGTLSLCVLDANTGKLLFGKNENVGVATASTLKTITSATAFSMLGADFTYETTLAYTGKIDTEGVLQGDLVIIGGGDPTLGSWRYPQTKENIVLDRFVTAVRNAGIKKIEGRIIGDDRLYGTQTTPEGWIWQDIGNYYGAGTSALTWRENQFDIHLKPGTNVGSPVRIVKTVPETSYIQIINELSTGGSGTGDNVYAFLPPYSTTAYLRGTWGIGIGKSGISVALPDPAFDAALRLQDTLKRLNISSSKSPTTARRLTLENKDIPSVTQKLAAIKSPSLSEIIYWFQKKSVNLYGEQLMKTIALKSGKIPSTKNGVNAVINYWAGKGIDRNALNILDGSGLSPGTRVTSYAMATVLFLAQREPWFKSYLNSFPENNDMKLKSGTINDVSAYVGYYTDDKGNKYIAVININNYSGSGIAKKLFVVLDALK